jgi:hypothetical protein
MVLGFHHRLQACRKQERGMEQERDMGQERDMEQEQHGQPKHNPKGQKQQ